MFEYKVLRTIFVAVVSAVVAAACGSDSSFVVKGTVEGNRDTSLRLIYADADGLHNAMAIAEKGALEYRGQISGEAIVEVLDNNYRPIVFFYVEPGDLVTLTVNPADPTASKIGGTEINGRWQKWRTDNARLLASGDIRRINAAVAAYVGKHPDDILSVLLLATQYDASADPAKAARLLQSINAGVCPQSIMDMYFAGLPPYEKTDGMATRLSALEYLVDVPEGRDTLTTFSPKNRHATLLAFSDEYSRSAGAVDTLREWYAQRPARTALLDVRLETDTVTWHRLADADSLSWRTAWVPGALAAPQIIDLNISSLPYYMVVDSLGRPLYSGTSLQQALQHIGQKSKKQ